MNFRYPSAEEIDALMRAARRDRAEHMALLIHAAGARLRGLNARGKPSDISIKKERPMAKSFWKTAAASLPPQIQWRYAGLFEAAERYERLFDFLVTSGGRACSALARTCRWLADALRIGARRLDVAARRLTAAR